MGKKSSSKMHKQLLKSYVTAHATDLTSRKQLATQIAFCLQNKPLVLHKLIQKVTVHNEQIVVSYKKKTIAYELLTAFLNHCYAKHKGLSKQVIDADPTFVPLGWTQKEFAILMQICRVVLKKNVLWWLIQIAVQNGLRWNQIYNTNWYELIHSHKLVAANNLTQFSVLNTNHTTYLLPNNFVSYCQKMPSAVVMQQCSKQVLQNDINVLNQYLTSHFLQWQKLCHDQVLNWTTIQQQAFQKTVAVAQLKTCQQLVNKTSKAVLTYLLQYNYYEACQTDWDYLWNHKLTTLSTAFQHLEQDVVSLLKSKNALAKENAQLKTKLTHQQPEDYKQKWLTYKNLMKN